MTSEDEKFGSRKGVGAENYLLYRAKDADMAKEARFPSQNITGRYGIWSIKIARETNASKLSADKWNFDATSGQSSHRIP